MSDDQLAAARSAYLREEIEVDDFEQQVDMVLRGLMPAPADSGVLHGPLYADGTFFAPTAPIELVRDRLKAIDRAHVGAAMPVRAVWEWERLLAEHEARQLAQECEAVVRAVLAR